jgi:hypothetical protein
MNANSIETVVLADRVRITNIVANDVKGRVVTKVAGKGFLVAFYNWRIKPGELRVDFDPKPSIVYVLKLEFLSSSQAIDLEASAVFKNNVN